jgi:hypothetical protein
MDDLEGPPLTHAAHHRLHHCHGCATPGLLCHVIVCIYACQLLQCRWHWEVGMVGDGCQIGACEEDGV